MTRGQGARVESGSWHHHASHYVGISFVSGFWHAFQEKQKYDLASLACSRLLAYVIRWPAVLPTQRSTVTEK